MKDWSIDILKDVWVKLGCFLTGYSYTLIRNSSESSRKTVKKFLSAIILVGAVWSAVGYLFAERYFGANRSESLLAGIAMFILVIQIERQIILTTSLTLWGKSSRVVLGLLMALIGATVIDQIMFQEDVEKYKKDNAEVVVAKRIAFLTDRFNKQISEHDSSIAVLTLEREALLREASLNPKITVYQSKRSKNTDSEGNIIGSSSEDSSYQIENPKFQLATRKDEQIFRREQEKNDIQSQLATMWVDQREQLILERNGFLTELEYLLQILKERPVARYFYLIWFSLLVLIEVLVLITKNGAGSTDYERLIQHQSDINKQAIKSLSENS